MKRILFFIVLILFAIYVMASFHVFGQEGPVLNTPAFDHSNCQYPDRTTNPPDGCDNTDPCDPANVKAGSGECTEVPQSQVEPMSHNVETGVYPVDYGDNYGK